MTHTDHSQSSRLIALRRCASPRASRRARAASPAAASKSQWSMFEDHVFLVRSGPAVREQTLDEIRALGADTLRIEVKWSEVAPSPARKSKPAFDATDPAAYPGFEPYDDLVQRAVAQGLPDHDHARSRRPQLGDGRRARRQLQGRLERLRRLRARRRAPLLGHVRRPARR